MSDTRHYPSNGARRGTCVYCGRPVRGDARTCSYHADLRRYDPHDATYWKLVPRA